MRVEQGEANNDVFVVIGEEYREPVREELVAPGVRVGFGPDGETVLVEIFGDEAGQIQPS